MQPTLGGFSSGGHAVVLDPAAQNVYFIDQNNSTTNSQIWRVPTTGSGGQVFAPGLSWPVALAVDSSNVYWTDINDAFVYAQSLSGGAPRVLATGQYYPMDIAVLDSQTLYWTACTDRTGAQCYIWSLPVGGGTPSAIYALSGGGNPSLSLLYPNLYVASLGLRAVLSIAVGPGGTTATLDSGGPIFSVAAAAGNVAWLYGESAMGASDGLVKAATIGFSPVLVAAGQNPYAVAVDANYAYWANQNDANVFYGTIVKAPTYGGSLTVLVTHASTFDIAIDSTYVYWLGFDDSANGLFRSPK